MKRKYSLSEVDRMRAALHRGTPFVLNYGINSNAQAEQTAAIERSSMITAYNTAIEQTLRTYMMAGIDPEELEATVIGN